jgi:hypothetical protein
VIRNSWAANPSTPTGANTPSRSVAVVTAAGRYAGPCDSCPNRLDYKRVCKRSPCLASLPCEGVRLATAIGLNTGRWSDADPTRITLAPPRAGYRPVAPRGRRGVHPIPPIVGPIN